MIRLPHTVVVKVLRKSYTPNAEKVDATAAQAAIDRSSVDSYQAEQGIIRVEGIIETIGVNTNACAQCMYKLQDLYNCE